MSNTILKIGDLDLHLQGQIGLQTSRIIILTVNHLTVLNFTFQLELCIDQLKVLAFLKTCELAFKLKILCDSL